MITDEAHLPELTRRQEGILALIIRSYTDNPEPVSSKYLVEISGLGVSSATVRNEMAELERMGYLAAPHTSAGRVPTELGYRYFVKFLLHDQTAALSVSEQNQLAARFQNATLATEQGMNLAATLLARTVRTAALVTPPMAEINRFKHLELIAIQGRMVLMVLVLQGGTVVQEMLPLPEAVPQARLSEVAARLNALCEGHSAQEMRLKANQLDLLEHDLLDLVANHTARSDANGMRVYRDGLSDIIHAFPTNQGAQQAIRVFEERDFLKGLLNDVLGASDNHQVQVLIAGDGKWDAVRHLTLVLTRYGIPGQASGALGILGPTHINYGRAISTVRYVAGLLTEMVVTLYNEDGEALPKGNPSSADLD